MSLLHRIGRFLRPALSRSNAKQCSHSKPYECYLLACAVLICGQVAADPAPDWVFDIEPGTWATVGENSLSDVDPADDPDANPEHPGSPPWNGTNGQSAMIGAWNGGAFATDFGRSGALIVYGGGHNDYWGSEVYAFDMDTLRWERLSDPYAGPFNWPYGSGSYPDGSAIPPHTYDYVEYHRGTQSFVVLKGQDELGPPSNNTTVSVAHLFDLSTRTWRRSQINSAATMHSGGTSCYDIKRDVLWTAGPYTSSGARFTKYDPKGTNPDDTVGTYTNYTEEPHSIEAVATCDPINDIYIYGNFRTGGEIRGRDLGNPESTRVVLNDTGNVPEKVKSSGWEWSPSRESIIYWGSGSGVYELKLSGDDWRNDPWVWTRLTDASNTLTPAINKNGVFSRFRLATYDDAEVAVAVTAVDGPVYAFRIPDGGASGDPIGGEPPSDFRNRAESIGVLYATNFDDVYIGNGTGVAALNATRSGIGNTAELIAEAHETPGRDQLIWDSNVKLSGGGALRLTRLPGDGGGTPASWSFRPNGVDGTTITEFYFQVAVRFSREDVAWRSDDPGSPKVIKFGQFFENGELVITHWKYSGFIGAVLNGSDFSGRAIPSSPDDSWLGEVRLAQGARYPTGGLDGLSKVESLRRTGPMRDNQGLFGGSEVAGDYSYRSGSGFLDERSSVINNGGFPNAWAKASGAVAWEPDEWVVVEAYVNSATQRALIWAAPYGQEPRLIINTDLSTNTLKANTDDHWRYIQLLNQSTNVEADSGRPDQHRWYDEIIVSKNPINFPGGYSVSESGAVKRPAPPTLN